MTAVRKKPRERKCRVCGKKYTPFQSLQATCMNYTCMLLYGKELKERASRREKREGRERLKTRSDWTKDAQKAFNAFIRERDADQPCISCGRWTRAKYNAGHYKPTGSN